ncbi:hypothetical protein RRU94_16450 [Domibacillus sp. DTU_2020_1001157_1_SI_ALB_TIR_016]|uniref:hypothetical protein n=1 Tax=Domibacillus sp. DTU_2020_1001157_1_SI_ALB_TIR_016 TaxID=3077789 RepID=UPI0028E79EC3|nr:hypothetical protein [Domibacillus sp. DTU_2020_1001157_1_SI_ALB_TIR_016]WNS82326.1 hypothetical protein RRU94_16450 [Domibacillus sp. DTU_2020_1001157_1_SI_ALB_TIR_016]
MRRRLLWDERAAETGEKPPGEIGLSACPMESGAAWTPPLHPIYVYGYQYNLSTV